MPLIKNQINSKIIQSYEEEMKRIAIDLHEGVGQTLFSLYTSIHVIENGVIQPEMKEFAAAMADQLEKTIREIRFLTVELHPPALTEFGLVPALKSYLQLFTSTYGIVVDLENTGNEVPLSERLRLPIFRVCQEALGNIAQYADTSKASIQVKWTKNTLDVCIKDEGRGFNVGEAMMKSTGLAAMRERIQLIGGEWAISSTIGKGTIVEMSLPL